MKPDIQNAADVKHLVDTFYTKAIHDKIIGYLFTDIAKINLETHMPTMYLFWNAVLFGEGGYRGNTIAKHIELHRKEPLTDIHFAQWKKLFFETIDEFYEGKIANLAKEKANAMIYLMQFKIDMSEHPSFIQ